ncbi:MAG TPA: GAF domain-containing sensor histidine kinase, partial [Chitinophagaceae bacterium]|nr:GAF domain-containing sensor histidine kinase [Chitinophagaceae bacterium]
AKADERFEANALVVNDPHIRFYAGFPLVAPGGSRLGTLCVIDREPRTLPATQLQQLQQIANQAMKLLELHKANRLLQQLRDREGLHRQELERLVNNQRKMVAILAHDTRGALYSMKQLLRMFIAGEVPRDQAGKLLEMMGEQTEITISMVENLVKWGELHLHAGGTGTVDLLREIVQEIFRQVAPAAQTKNIQLLNEVGGEATLQTNGELLRFIVRNLLTNAVKYTEHGTVHVTGRRNGDRYLLCVADTGTGMTAESRKALFKGKAPSQAGTRKEPGSGLGLLLIHEFVQQAGGFIEVQSRLKKGTTICISLPCT